MIRFIPFFICLVLFSCKKDIDDLEKPVIANLATSTEEVSINSSFNILLLVKDNMSLSAVKLTVYPSFYFADDTSFSKKRFNYSYVEETNESKVNLSIPLTINDSTATGIYTIEAQAVDKKGNTSEKVYKTFKIISSINAPSINVSFPVSGGSYNSSDTLNFTGTITDNEAIKQIAIVSTQEDFWSNTA